MNQPSHRDPRAHHRRTRRQPLDGFFTVDLATRIVDGALVVDRSALLRTARALMRGTVLVPERLWDSASVPAAPA